MTSSPSLDGAAIVVGVSRRTGSPAALRFALRESHLRGATVLAVTAWRPPRPGGSPGGKPIDATPISADDAWQQEYDRLRSRLSAELGDDAAAVTFALRRGAPAAVLLEATREAQLLVLDAPRAGHRIGLPSAWLAPSIVLRAHCPVVVMPRLGRE